MPIGFCWHLASLLIDTGLLTLCLFMLVRIHGCDWHCPNPVFFCVFQSQEIDVLIGKDRETFYTSGLTLGSKKCSVLRDSLHDEGDWTMDIRTKSQGGEPTYNISVGKAGKGKLSSWVSLPNIMVSVRGATTQEFFIFCMFLKCRLISGACF